MVSECTLDASTGWIQRSSSTSCSLFKLNVYLHCHLLVTGVSCDYMCVIFPSIGYNRGSDKTFLELCLQRAETEELHAGGRGAEGETGA